jgi:dienelactone hydrolase
MTTKRWQAQRWVLDNIIRTVGVDWDQGRSFYLQAPCGPDAFADFQGIRQRVQKFSDIAREFGRAATRRERLACLAEQEGHLLSARDHFFVASILYGGAQWPIFENTPENLRLNAKKVEMYEQYIRLADRPVRRVEIPFQNGSLPAYLHLPPRTGAEKPPAVLAIDGMDGFKEMMVSLNGDKLLERGIAVLAVDGPGQGECTVRDIHVTGDNFMHAGRAALDWLREQPEIDAERIAVSGVSFGSYWATQVAAAVERLAGCAVAFVCHEPGGHTIFNLASPTFKLRFMYMAGYTDEDEFDAFAQTISLKGIGSRVRCPYLVIAGEDDELSPIEHTYALLNEMSCPRELLVYQGEKHGLNSTTSGFLGPSWSGWMADWLADRLQGAKPADSREVVVDLSGQTRTRGWEDSRPSA